MCVCVCIYIYICIHIYKYMCIKVYIYMYVYKCIHILTELSFGYFRSFIYIYIKMVEVGPKKE